jgi:hypothetical protein
VVETPELPASQAGLGGLAKELVEQAAGRGITLRLIGSIAIRERCAEREEVFALLDRELPLDIDLVGYTKQQPQIDQMFKALGYRIDPTIAQSQEWGIQRLIYHAADGKLKVDIFLDVLRMSHTIDFKGRLDLTPVTVTPADLLLAKLQVFQITEKDLKDIVALLLVEDLSEDSAVGVDVRYLLSRLGRDWGLYYTAAKNLALAEAWLEAHRGLPQKDVDAVRERLADLKRRIDAEPKTLGWRLRAAVGPRIQWYEEVGDVDR